MANLPTDDRVRVWRGLNRATLLFGGVPGVVKSDLQAAVNATDDWIEANQASYNAALPATFRVNASAAQKTLLFCAVALARVSTELLRSIFGGVE